MRGTALFFKQKRRLGMGHTHPVANFCEPHGGSMDQVAQWLSDLTQSFAQWPSNPGLMNLI